MGKLTKTFIDKVQPPAEGYAMHWDDSLKGYGLRVTAAGKRVFVAQGRVLGKAVCFTIGPFGEWTEFEAREKARKVLQGMREGIDPRDVKKADEATKVTLRQVADAYMGRPGKLKDSSKSEIERHVTTTFEAWQHKPITGITEDDCRKRYNEILTKGLRGKAPAPGQAVQAFSVLRALINFAGRRYKRADGTPLILHNPVAVLKDDWVTLPERKTRIPESKIGPVWSALQQWRDQAYNRDTLASIDLVIFLVLTGARIGEAAALTWDRINLDEGWWHLPDPKNRNPVWLPLSTQAVQLLTTRQRVEGSPFVFSSWGKAGHIKDPRDTMKKVSEVAGTKITPHDLRRTFTTFGVANCGVDLHKIELLTNHVPRGVTAKHYLETSHLQYLKPEVQRIADWIGQQAAKANGANVVPLRA
ncbi:tyrosine-type recombinase/integrase [Comamonas kerstersii]|uniref:Site-specific integrase n=1 Tax=Comamonas kerstersii TaxID=225992 RepID=A0A6A1R6A4_9BURK|nr:site-specific integrase [Comamonas kerstersii]KAB0588436.1 site-specific integrase [Comamonas kerstersii]